MLMNVPVHHVKMGQVALMGPTNTHANAQMDLMGNIVK